MAVSYLNLKAKQTEAIAPRSLFGTSIEINEGESSVNDTEIHKANKKRQKPDKTAAFRPPSADEKLRIMKEAIERQDLKLKSAEGRLKNRQTNALQFTADAELENESESFESKRTYSPYRADVKHQPRDIALAAEFNILGLDDRRDYNYERCRPRLKIGTYQQVGDVLTTGNLFTYKGQSKQLGVPQNSKLGVSHATRSPSCLSTCSDASSIPLNIKHTYGEELCKKAKSGMIQKHLSVDEKNSASLSIKATPEPERDPMYDALGHALRQDIFNGVPHNKFRSLNTDSYTQAIHDKSTNEFPPKFAVQRNYDSKWAEDCVIRARVMKAWDQMVAEKLTKDAK